MPRPPTAPEEPPSEPESWLDPLFDDATLRPLLAVGVLVVATFGAALFVLALSDRNRGASAALALLFGVTLFAIDSERRRGPLGRLPWLLGAIWALSLAGGLLYGWALPR